MSAVHAARPPGAVHGIRPRERRREGEPGREQGAAGGCPGEGIAAVLDHGKTEMRTMTTALAVPDNTASTFLTHIFGTGLVDDRYVVERFKARADGDIRPWSGEAAAKKGRRGTKRATASLRAVKEMRPDRTEIIVCTGISTRGGVQYWGWIAMGIGVDRKQKG